ncbi:MAG: SGNH/GDSL hydrolase family protein [Oscillospiraceae bacterium]|nr:SGNH/GDSL hydrolase family protein [Oscillospiraceae bacterium]
MTKVLLLLIPAVLFLTVIWLVVGGREPEDVTGPGIAYLEALEQKDPGAVDQFLRDRRQAELEAQREELLRQVREDELDPFTLFQDAVIMGDSRAQGFWYFGYVDESRTLTGAGHTILDIANQMDILEEMNPQYIYLCYGLNDVKIGFWGSVDRYVTRYMEYVAQIRERMPGAVVVISSTLPYLEDHDNDAEEIRQDPEREENAELDRMIQIPAWNEALAKACAENDVIFVDNTAICEEHEDLWELDGIHVKKPFYSLWGKNLVVAALAEGSTQVEEIDS